MDLHALRPLRFKSRVSLVSLFVSWLPTQILTKLDSLQTAKRKLALTEYLPCVWHIISPVKSSPCPM